MAQQFAAEILEFSSNSRNDAVEVEGSIVWPARVHPWVGILSRCLTEREARVYHRPNFCVDT